MATACNVCENARAAQLIFLFIILPLFSVVVILILSYTQQRKRTSTCGGGCHGHMGLPIPMNFLISPRHRLPYILVFPLLATDLFNAVLSLLSVGEVSTIFIVNTLYIVLILPALVTIFVSVRYLPLFACIEAPFPFLGHCLGLAYSILWLIVESFLLSVNYYCRVCPSPSSSSSYLKVVRVVFSLQVLPVSILILSVVLWYTWQVLAASSRKLSSNPDLLVSGFYSPTGAKDYQLKHVQKLFSKEPPSPERGKWTVLLWTVFRYFIPYSKYRRLPVIFLGVVVAMVMFLYRISLELLVNYFYLLDQLSSQYQQLKSSYNFTKSTKVIAEGIFIGLPVISILSVIVSLIVTSFLLMHMVSSVSKMMKVVAKHGFREKLPSTPYRVPLSIKYFGLQFGFLFVAWVMYFLLSFLVLLAALLIILGLELYTTRTIDALLTLIIPILWYKGVFYVQFLICKFAFFKDSEGKFLPLTNYRLFNWFAYVLMLYNWFAGFLGAIFRILLSAGISLLLLFRLDIFVLTTGYEFMDFGHRAFLGFMYLDHCYNNAVVHTFIHTLKGGSSLRGVANTAQPRHRKEDYIVNPHVTVTTKNRQCLNRWLVAYTLLRNPSLLHSTAANMAAAGKGEESGETTPTSEIMEAKSSEPLLQFRDFD